MALLSLRNVSLAYGGPTLLDEVGLQVERGERICLLGRNGAGKSTLLGVIAGEVRPDGGAVDRQQGLRVARLPQEVPQHLQGSVFEIVARGLGEAGEALCRHHELSGRLAAGEQELLPRLSEVQHALEEAGGWELLQRVEQALTRLKLDGDAPLESLSGGVKRRVLLARALAVEPDILLLDEPTNHLDIESIDWLEQFLLRSGITLVFVTHDRAFLRALATRIVEIDRGRLFDFACDYDTFLQRKEELLHAEDLEWQRLDKKLAEEEVWIRKGIKARRTRNEGRVRALKKLREERRQRRERTGTARLKLHEAERSGKLVAKVENISFAYGKEPIIRDFSTTVVRGDRIGIIGPNGAGKTTLLRLLLGKLAPQAGSVKLGTNLQVLYFDQLREQLDPERTVQQNLSGDQDTVLVGGQPRHVYGYLQDFLFTPDRARTPVRFLSGGERNRLLLARLFTREANVLVLDEPTNDLDLETLELLEELLADFQGTVFLVSHDRDFLNRCVTSTVAFEGEGQVREYFGGYDDWLRQRPGPEEPAPAPRPAREKPARQRERRQSFKEKRELEELPGRIEALDGEIEALHAQLADPDFYREAGAKVAAATARLEELEKELQAAYARWEELEAIPT
ncbi:MAG: ABC transporter ATP-binding protein [Desulfuromonas sp.]|uniref:ATP-binding cassette domain-containing protein n=1 Tax=Desulfuromonas sp. TaxID=892 RepID=UPI000CAD77B7|nr:ATP-binding cassette domain-containing protein [Desulfuromonas sp.]PLX83926.1 MAG: ABC transporter ATP-binding protein [Desulfuromonas sp.]